MHPGSPATGSRFAADVMTIRTTSISEPLLRRLGILHRHRCLWTESIGCVAGACFARDAIVREPGERNGETMERPSVGFSCLRSEIVGISCRVRDDPEHESSPQPDEGLAAEIWHAGGDWMTEWHLLAAGNEEDQNEEYLPALPRNRRGRSAIVVCESRQPIPIVS